jgi:hypothetical protein
MTVRNPQFDIDATIPVVDRLKEAGDFEGAGVVERLYVAADRLVSLTGEMPKRGYGDPVFDAHCRGDLALRIARGEA